MAEGFLPAHLGDLIVVGRRHRLRRRPVANVASVEDGDDLLALLLEYRIIPVAGQQTLGKLENVDVVVGQKMAEPD